MRSLIATVAFSFVYSFLAFKTWWKRGLLIASAFPLAVFGNLTRMLTIVLTADIWGQEAGNYVHEGGPLGLISLFPYIPAFAGLLILGNYLREEHAESASAMVPEPERI
jgi:exosortase/archaeosortase family protein